MAYDYSKLLGRIIEKYSTQQRFAAALGVSERTFSLKINGRIAFKQPEILRAGELLDIPAADLHLYFFTLKVQEVEQ